MSSLRRMGVTCAAALLAPLAQGQDSPASPAPATSQPAAAAANPSKKKHGHADDFLIRGTVFNHEGLSFPGVQLRVRRTDEKKYRWERYTNSRGEFGVLVPRGPEYEMVVRVKGFADQKRIIDGRTASDEERMVFRLEPAEGKKK